MSGWRERLTMPAATLRDMVASVAWAGPTDGDVSLGTMVGVWLVVREGALTAQASNRHRGCCVTEALTDEVEPFDEQLPRHAVDYLLQHGGEGMAVLSWSTHGAAWGARTALLRCGADDGVEWERSTDIRYKFEQALVRHPTRVESWIEFDRAEMLAVCEAFRACGVTYVGGWFADTCASPRCVRLQRAPCDVRMPNAPDADHHPVADVHATTYLPQWPAGDRTVRVTVAADYMAEILAAHVDARVRFWFAVPDDSQLVRMGCADPGVDLTGVLFVRDGTRTTALMPARWVGT